MYEERLKKYTLKSSYDDVITAIDDYLTMVSKHSKTDWKMCETQGMLYWKINFI